MQEEVRLLFHKLANLTHAERERALSEPALDPGVRREVESLLEFDSTRPEHLAACIAGTAEEMLRKAAPRAPAECGPYRLVRLLGAGGMGAVYLAERNDGEIQQTVAVKLLRADSSRAAWHERFLNERQLLASLSHPSIVRLTDAGHTADDRPYLVMEYVEGRPIDEYAAGMPLREQLAIFLQVCEGVSYAHSHLVVHRDLKPSNILVDASGQAKVLDFGIAKLLDESGDATQTVERLVTPNYASPEQLRGSAQTTATDVYSLGAVFYKMLTGRSPHLGEIIHRHDVREAVLVESGESGLALFAKECRLLIGGQLNLSPSVHRVLLRILGGLGNASALPAKFLLSGPMHISRGKPESWHARNLYLANPQRS